MAFHRGDYEVHRAEAGFASIRQISSGEIMHSRTPPMEEAQRLYIEQSNLAARLQLSSEEIASGIEPEPLVIWDVGLGAAANAMAAILCYETLAAAGPVRPMHVVSFENDLDPLHLAFQHNREFTYLRHSGIGAILAIGRWQSRDYSGLRWTLVEGDFLDSIPNSPAAPDLIFFDMFSSKTDGDQWTLGAFRQIHAACAGRAVELFTYSCSTPIRAALLAAGFHVAKGQGTVDKLDTTIALTPEAIRPLLPRTHELLGAEWLARWNRSSAKFPADLPADQQPAFEQTIRTHSQFQNL
jgi:queuine tRNA-ribosyltransferase